MHVSHVHALLCCFFQCAFCHIKKTKAGKRLFALYYEGGFIGGFPFLIDLQIAERRESYASFALDDNQDKY